MLVSILVYSQIHPQSQPNLAKPIRASCQPKHQLPIKRYMIMHQCICVTIAFCLLDLNCRFNLCPKILQLLINFVVTNQKCLKYNVHLVTIIILLHFFVRYLLTSHCKCNMNGRYIININLCRVIYFLTLLQNILFFQPY